MLKPDPIRFQLIYGLKKDEILQTLHPAHPIYQTIINYRLNTNFIFSDLTFHRADSYTRTLSSGKTLSTRSGNGTRIVSRSASCPSVSKLGSTHLFLFHSMTLHSTECIHTRVHYPPGKPYPPNLEIVFGLYPDPHPARRYPYSDPPTHFYSIQWTYISQSGFILAHTILWEGPTHRTW